MKCATAVNTSSFWLAKDGEEIDVQEFFLNGNANRQLMATNSHKYYNNWNDDIPSPTSFPTGYDLDLGYHTYGVDWERDSIQFYFDGQLVGAAKQNQFQLDPMHVILDTELFNYLSSGIPASAYSAATYVDYVRHWTHTSTTPPANYTWVCDEWQSKTFQSPVDVAFGLGTSSLYKYDQVGTVTFSNDWFGKDPDIGVGKSGYFRDFQACAAQNDAYTFTLPVEVAYGIGGKYIFENHVSGPVTFNNATFGNPNPGVLKWGWYMPYDQCAVENQSYTFNSPVDVAYGANGQYKWMTNVTGTVTFNNATFGDPAYGVVKAGYFRPAH